MSNNKLTFRGISPIHSPLNLQLGVDQFSLQFTNALKKVESTKLTDKDLNWLGTLTHLGGEQQEQRQYASTKGNSKDVRLMCWSPIDNPNVMFHVFSNNIAIAEVELTLDIEDITGSLEHQVEVIEDRVQVLANIEIKNYINDFTQDLKQLYALLSSDFTFYEKETDEKEYWVSRAMLITDDLLTKQDMPELITTWLQDTRRPEDAAEIIAGKKDFSLTWLNYVIKKAKAVGKDPHIQMMILAQYYYVSQENCNSALRGAIEAAYTRERKQENNKVLADNRTACRLNQIAYFENIKFLSKTNRSLVEDILTGWNFIQLFENSERMIDICNVRLQEEDNKKRERSTIMTDFLLVTLSFFTVFELSLYLTEFSREMMSRPALDYNDNKSSFFLGFIAEIDSDIMFSFGFGLTLLLIIVYRHIKRN